MIATTYVFLYACAAFSCMPNPSLPGDGAYYDTQPKCVHAARDHAKRRAIRLGRWEIACVERPKP